MRYHLECPANRYIFKSRLNCSESTAGSLRQSGSEFLTVVPATEKARQFLAVFNTVFVLVEAVIVALLCHYISSLIRGTDARTNEKLFHFNDLMLLGIFYTCLLSAYMLQNVADSIISSDTTE